MANKKRSYPGIAIAVGPRFSPGESVAMVIVTTAATYAAEHFDEFEKWLNEENEKAGHAIDDGAQIDKELLLLSIFKLIRMMPERV